MANPRKPRAFKLLQGTDRKDRRQPEPEFPTLDDAPPPAWLLNDDARAEWNRLVGLLVPTRVLTEADITALGHLCNLHGECLRLYRASIAPHAATLTQLRLYLAEFGMTPASRGRAQPAGSGQPKNKFAQLAQGGTGKR
ncbi:MAG: P27 family phage terminase small subunit [Gemmatimonadaceae bacterium]|nr:P27 family phage terminase small subunit [Gemmatimonadaceae bacterium]